MAFAVAEQLCQAASDERSHPLAQLKDMVVSEQLPPALLRQLASATYKGPDGHCFQIIPELVRTSTHISESRDLACLQRLVDAGGDVLASFTGCVPCIERAGVLEWPGRVEWRFPLSGRPRGWP